MTEFSYIADDIIDTRHWPHQDIETGTVWLENLVRHRDVSTF